MNYNSTTNTLEIEGAVTGDTIALVGTVDGGLFIVEDTTVPDEPDDPIVDPDEPEDKPEDKPCDNPWCGHATLYDINQCIQSGYFVYPCGTSSYYPPVSKPESCNCECDSYTKDQVNLMIQDIKDLMLNSSSNDIVSALSSINDTLQHLQIGIGGGSDNPGTDQPSNPGGGTSCTCDSYTKEEIDSKIEGVEDKIEQKHEDDMPHVLITQNEYDALKAAGELDTTVLYLVYEGVAVQSVTISQKTATLNVNDTLKLGALVLPSDATNKSCTWSSSNSAVCSVDSTGLVTANASGQATITVSTTGIDKKKDTCIITVSGGQSGEPVTGVTIELTGTYDSSTYTFTTNGSYDPTTQTLIIR